MAVSKIKVVLSDVFHDYVETEKLVIELVFFNGFELYVKMGLFRSSYAGFKSWFCYSACIGINVRFRGRICAFSKVPLLLKLLGIGFYSVFEMCVKR